MKPRCSPELFFAAGGVWPMRRTLSDSAQQAIFARAKVRVERLDMLPLDPDTLHRPLFSWVHAGCVEETEGAQ
jgi:hypothetical protein